MELGLGLLEYSTSCYAMYSKCNVILQVGQINALPTEIRLTLSNTEVKHPIKLLTFNVNNS